MNAQMRMPESGSVVRSQSRRRFIVAGEERFNPGNPWIEKRSDSKDVAMKERSKARSRNHSAIFIVFDSVTGESF